jgi:hypothetical protein
MWTQGNALRLFTVDMPPPMLGDVVCPGWRGSNGLLGAQTFLHMHPRSIVQALTTQVALPLALGA